MLMENEYTASASTCLNTVRGNKLSFMGYCYSIPLRTLRWHFPIHQYQWHGESGREICFQIRFHVKCSGISESGKSVHIQYHPVFAVRRKGYTAFDKGYAGVTHKLHMRHFNVSAHLFFSLVFTKLHGLRLFSEVQLTCWVLNSLDKQ